MKVKPSEPLRWITLPPQTARRTKRVKTKQIILFALMIATFCAAAFLLAPRVMARDGTPTIPPAGSFSQPPHPSGSHSPGWQPG